MSIYRNARKNKSAFAVCLVVLVGVLASACQNTGGYGSGSPSSSPMSKPSKGSY